MARLVTCAGRAGQPVRPEKGGDGGMRSLIARHPEQFYLYSDRIESALIERLGSSEPSPYSLTDFTKAALHTKRAEDQGHLDPGRFAHR